MKKHTLLLFKNRRPGETVFIEEYRKQGGYTALFKALREMTPAEIRDTVKASGLRGRGGAGFPTGTKWSFFPSVITSYSIHYTKLYEIPEGIRCRTVFSLPTTSVWPALLPP